VSRWREPIGRRQFVAGAGAALLGSALGGCTFGARSAAPAAAAGPALALAPLLAAPERITAITVCTRPFRAQGPRLEVEQIQGKTVVHNYGHGGSGWSLSWGAGALAAEKALAGGEREVAVIGCGAIGLTTALQLQRSGATVTIYAKELPPEVRSSLATGVFTPDSRICFEEHATPAFRQLWEGMARRSFANFQRFLGLPGTPVEFVDNYFVSDSAEPTHRGLPPDDPRPRFADLQGPLLGDLLPRTEHYAPGRHPLGARYLRGGPQLMFNLSAYTQLLMSEFHENGGRLRIEEFHTPADFARVRERTLVNATGYGARALLGDESLVPVRGQLARTIPQPDIHYGLLYSGVAFVPRRDGFVFQAIGTDDYYGFGDETTTPDRAEAERAIGTIARLFSPA
jgi:glycine/D-amino acid oxidase-like deaminating enzyme